jgi:hypothetical protein
MPRKLLVVLVFIGLAISLAGCEKTPPATTGSVSTGRIMADSPGPEGYTASKPQTWSVQ